MKWLKLLLALAVVVLFVVVARTLPVGQWIAAFQQWVRGAGFGGYVAYALLFAVFTVLLVPTAPLTVGAGILFGFVKGTIVVVLGATLGATAAFLLARTMLRRRVETMTASNPRFRALDRAITSRGGWIVFLVRLAPPFPFTWVNFAFGLTGVRTGAYVLATFLGVTPIAMAFVYVSAAAATAATAEPGNFRLWLNVAGAILTVVATIYVTRVASRAIRRAGIDEA